MNSLSDGIRNAIAYIEANLTEPVRIEDIAAKAYVSPYYFQRMFHALCGIPVGEYIRCRRLSAAAQELSQSGARVLDIALKYGYESQDSFARAFQRFHGVSPAAAKECGVHLKAFAPLQIKITLEGGSVMEYKIVEKAAFTVLGKSRSFSYETSYQEIPKYWAEYMQTPDVKIVCGMYGICMGKDAVGFEYVIADDYCPMREIPAGFFTRTIPAGTWAVFPCRGPIVETLQRINRRIWDEWMPNSTEYQPAGDYSIEAYPEMPHADPAEDYCEIWIPVKKVSPAE